MEAAYIHGRHCLNRKKLNSYERTFWIDCTLPGTDIFRLRRRNLLLVGVSFIIVASLIIHDVRVTRPPFCFTRANRRVFKTGYYKEKMLLVKRIYG